MKKRMTLAVVQVTVEVFAGTYNEEATVDFITTQAAREGVNRVLNLIGTNGKVIGEPEVRTVTTFPEK